MQKLNKILCLLWLSVSISGFYFLGSQTVLAADEGGAVQTNGQVGFYETSSDSSSDSSNSDKPDQPDKADRPDESSIKKPVGRYPSTGELIKRGLSISGVTLVVIALLFFIWKRRSNRTDEGGNSK